MPDNENAQLAISRSKVDKLPVWQQVYQQLRLNKIKGITSYQVNGNLFIVVPLEKNHSEN